MQLPRFGEGTRRQVEDGFEFMAGAYLVGLASWFALQQLIGDATWWLFLINAFAVYFFAPLPLALVVSVWRRRLPLIGGSLAGVALFVVLWGGLFWPQAHADAQGPTVTVMTYNVLGYNAHPEAVVEALRASDADVIGLQELNADVAAAVERELTDEYPYQLLTPSVGVSGSGVISRLPFNPVTRELDAPGWIGAPIALEVQFEGMTFLFVQVHNASGATYFREREAEAKVLSRLAETEALPLIVAGDFNATDRNDSYATLTRHLSDAWRGAGSGLGNTFPGASRSDTPRSSRPDPLGIDVPQWLLRIDYVFHSDDWQAVDARIGPWDGYSDHRPVIAELALKTRRELRLGLMDGYN
jgi:vancomycin resistance protein VanJ